MINTDDPFPCIGNKEKEGTHTQRDARILLGDEVDI